VTGFANAADFTWTNPAGGNFVGNFTPGGTPVSAIDTKRIEFRPFGKLPVWELDPD
jgi:hypothetical protein